MIASLGASAPRIFTIPADTEETLHIAVEEAGDIQMKTGDRSHTVAILRVFGTAQAIRHTLSVEVGVEARCTILCIATGTAPLEIIQKGSVHEGGRLLWQNITLARNTVTHDLVSRVVGAHGESAVDWMFY